MNRLVIIADDLTGAADTAACFAQGGLATVVVLDFETVDMDSETGLFPENPVSRKEETRFSRNDLVSSRVVSNQIDVLSLSTNTRELDSPEAARRVQKAADWLVRSRFAQPGTFFYKKIDSMLRGHPALELAALMGPLGLDRALVAPAFPAQGRVTRDGWQVISGSSLPWRGAAPAAHHRRGVDKRRSNLDRRINLAEVFAVSDRADTLLTGCFAKVCPYPVYLVPQAEVRQGWPPLLEGWQAGGAGIYIADAETEADLDRLARAALAGGLRLACGSAGLARALWRCGVVGAERSIPSHPEVLVLPCPLPEGEGVRIPLPLGEGRGEGGTRVVTPIPESDSTPATALIGKKTTLVVAGSRSAALERQVQAARDRQVVVVRPGLDWLERVDFQPGGLVTTLAETLRGGQAAILTTAGLPDSTLGAAQVAARLAEVAGQLVETGLVGGLVLTGGDTALAVCRRLGASLIGLDGEPVPGVASGVLLDGACPGLPVITRAGGFECDLAWLINLRV